MSSHDHGLSGWAITINGFSTMELASPYAPPREHLAVVLGRMDAQTFYALSISGYPSGLPFDRVKPKKHLQEYLQCAGSCERLTVEVRTRGAAGGFLQHVVGRRPVSIGPPTAEITWDSHSTRVLDSEVFDADGALEVFMAYLADSAVPASYALRQIVV